MADNIRAKIGFLKARVALAALAGAVDKAKGPGGGGQARWPAGTPLGGQWKGNGGGKPSGSSGGGQKSFFQSLFGGESKSPSYSPGGGDAFAMGMKQPVEPVHAKPHTKTAVKHQAVDDKGGPVYIQRPSTPTGKETWDDPNATATFVPGGEAPKVLNGVPMRKWEGVDDWTQVPGQNPDLEATLPDLSQNKWKHPAAGVIIEEPDGRVWLTTPTNHFGGYRNTYPKGTQEKGLTLQQTAIKEAWEETGLRIEITGVVGDFERTTSVSRFYTARRVGGTPTDQGWESQAIRLVPPGKLRSYLNMPVDREILDSLLEERDITKFRETFSPETLQHLGARIDAVLKAAKGPGSPKKGGAWQNQPRWPAGTPLGGQWKAYDSAGLVKPPKIGTPANQGQQNKANAVYALATSGDWAKVGEALYAAEEKVKAFGVTYGKDGPTYGKAPNSQQVWNQSLHQYVHGLIMSKNTALGATATVERLAGPDKLSDYKKIGPKPGGSNPGAVYTDKAGAKWLVKGANTPSDDRAKNEVLASKLMAAAGIGAPDMKLVQLEGQHGGGLGVAVKMVDLQGWSKNNAADLAAAQKDFAVHAWLANYDAVGQPVGDNLAKLNGQVFNYDPGGALLYRAQGAPKNLPGGMLAHAVAELEGMRNKSINPHAAAVYGSMTNSQLKESAKLLQKVDDKMIADLVKTYGPGDDAKKAALTTALIARRDYILDKLGVNSAAPAKTDVPVGAAAGSALADNAKDDVAAAMKPKVTGPAATAAPAAGAAGGLTYAVGMTNTLPGHNKFYSVAVGPDGSGGYTLTKTWGKIGSKGQTQTESFATKAAAEKAAVTLVGQKAGKGYLANPAFKPIDPAETGPKSSVTFGAKPPTDPQVGDLWTNNDNVTHAFDGTKWVAPTPNAEVKPARPLATPPPATQQDVVTAASGAAFSALLSSGLSKPVMAAGQSLHVALQNIDGMGTDKTADAKTALKGVAIAIDGLPAKTAEDKVAVAALTNMHGAIATNVDVKAASNIPTASADTVLGGDPLGSGATNPGTIKAGEALSKAIYNLDPLEAQHFQNMVGELKQAIATDDMKAAEGFLNNAYSAVAGLQANPANSLGKAKIAFLAYAASIAQDLEIPLTGAPTTFIGTTIPTAIMSAGMSAPDKASGGLKEALDYAKADTLAAIALAKKGDYAGGLHKLTIASQTVPAGMANPVSVGLAADMTAWIGATKKWIEGESIKTAAPEAGSQAQSKAAIATLANSDGIKDVLQQAHDAVEVAVTGAWGAKSQASLDKAQETLNFAAGLIVDDETALAAHGAVQGFLNAAGNIMGLKPKAAAVVPSIDDDALPPAAASSLKQAQAFASAATSGVGPGSVLGQAVQHVDQVHQLLVKTGGQFSIGDQVLAQAYLQKALDKLGQAHQSPSFQKSEVAGAAHYINEVMNVMAMDKSDFTVSAGALAALSLSTTTGSPTGGAAAPKIEMLQAVDTTPASGLPAKPTFQPTAPKAVEYYNDLVAKMDAAFAAGDSAALAAVALGKGGKSAWPLKANGEPKTTNAMLAATYHAVLSNKLAETKAAETLESLKPATPVLQGGRTAGNPAMPNFAAAKIPTSNSNAASHNKKIDEVQKLAEAGDVKGILALNYGSNTYGKKQAKVANDALAALGVAFVVTPGQKTNSHSALQAAGLVPSDKDNVTGIDEKPIGSTALGNKAGFKWVGERVQPGEVIVDKGSEFGVEFVKVQVPPKGHDPASLPKPMDHFTIGSQGPTKKWLSSNEKINQANNDSVNAIYELAKTGNVEALENVKVAKVVGDHVEMVSPKDHPAKTILHYHTEVLAEVKAQTQPTFKQYTYGSSGQSYSQITAAISKKTPPVPYGKFQTVKKKAADYLVLSETTSAIPVPKTGPGHFEEVNPSSPKFAAWRKSSKAAWESAPSAGKSAAQSYTGSAYYSMNASMRAGTPDTKSKQMIAALNKAAVPLPEGTILWRGINVGAETYKGVVGSIIQDGSVQSSSYGSKPAFSGKPTYLKIYTTKGTKAVDATVFSHFGTGESEIILKNNIRYLVMRVDDPGKGDAVGFAKGKTVVHLLALPHEDDFNDFG